MVVVERVSSIQGGRGLLTFEMKHCLTTKSRTSNGPSLQNVKRSRWAPVRRSMSPLSAKKSENDSRSLGHVGAGSTSA